MNIGEFGVGVDIENIARFNNLEKESSVLKRIFTDKELAYCFSKENASSSLAARYACKEATIKALSSIEEYAISYTDIEIINNEKGVPFVRIDGIVKSSFATRASISHSDDKAVAVVIVMRFP